MRLVASVHTKELMRVGHEQAVDEPAGGGSQRGDAERRPRAEMRLQLGRQHPGEHEQRAAGEVELADDEQEGEREGHQPDRRHLLEHVEQVGRGQERVAREGEHEEEHDDADDDHVLAQQLEGAGDRGQRAARDGALQRGRAFLRHCRTPPA
jgi:hypothetical protein